MFRTEWKKYYRTPELNEKLYLHFKGFGKMQNLEQFTNLKCLYFEGNGKYRYLNLTRAIVSVSFMAVLLISNSILIQLGKSEPTLIEDYWQTRFHSYLSVYAFNTCI